MAEIHFYDSAAAIPDTISPFYCWQDAERALNANEKQIHTTQMGLLNTTLFDKEYRIFIHSRDTYEIKLGENERTEREIRMGHNLFYLWQNGEFD